MKHVQKMMLVPEHLLQSFETEHRLTSPPQLATLTRLDQDMKQIMDSLLPEDQKISLLDQLLHRYQDLSRQIKTEGTVKPTVVTTVTPAPTKASPTHTPTTSLGKSAKVRTRKLPVTPRLSTSKIARPGGTASPSIPTPQSIPTSQSKIPVPIVKADEPVSSETPMFSEMPAFLFETPLSTPARKKAKTRKPRTPMVARLRSNRQWQPY